MKDSDFKKIHDVAVADTVDPDTEYHYRSICRTYSERFNTPLHVVYTLPPHFVLQNYYEDIMSNMDEDQFEQLLFKAAYPELDQDSEEEIQDFIQMIEDEEAGKRPKPKRRPDAKTVLKRSAKKKQSLKQAQTSGTSRDETVVRKYSEQPPPEAGLGDPDSLETPTSALRGSGEDQQ